MMVLSNKSLPRISRLKVLQSNRIIPELDYLVIEWQFYRMELYSKRDSSANSFLWILRNLSTQFFAEHIRTARFPTTRQEV